MQARGAAWDDAPLPSLIVEIFSDSTRRRDRVQKRGFYSDLGVPEYWMADPKSDTITAVRPGAEDVVATNSPGSRSPLSNRS